MPEIDPHASDCPCCAGFHCGAHPCPEGYSCICPGGIPPTLCAKFSFPAGPSTFQAVGPQAIEVGQRLYDWLTGTTFKCTVSRGIGINSCPDGRPVWYWGFIAPGAFTPPGGCTPFSPPSTSGSLCDFWFLQSRCVTYYDPPYWDIQTTLEYDECQSGGDRFLIGQYAVQGDPVYGRYWYRPQANIFIDPHDQYNDCSFRIINCEPFQIEYLCWIYAVVGESYTGPMRLLITECDGSAGPPAPPGSPMTMLAPSVPAILPGVVHLSGAGITAVMTRNSEGWAGDGYSLTTTWELRREDQHLGTGVAESLDPLYVGFRLSTGLASVTE